MKNTSNKDNNNSRTATFASLTGKFLYQEVWRVTCAAFSNWRAPCKPALSDYFVAIFQIAQNRLNLNPHQHCNAQTCAGLVDTIFDHSFMNKNIIRNTHHKIPVCRQGFCHALKWLNEIIIRCAHLSGIIRSESVGQVSSECAFPNSTLARKHQYLVLDIGHPLSHFFYCCRGEAGIALSHQRQYKTQYNVHKMTE